MKKFLKLFFLGLLVIILAAIAYPVINYFSWQKTFQSQLNQLVCKSNTESISNLDDKFKEFVMSDEDITYVELSVPEVLTLVEGTQIVEGAQLQNLCVLPNEGIWTLYLKFSIQNINMPWVRVDIAKDNMETAQLYVKNIYVGNFTLPQKFDQNLKTSLNNGISDSITVVNENNFLGRKIQNIELLKDSIIVKGSLN